MPKTLLELTRESFFRPREAAQYLLGRNLSRNTIALTALLVSILTVLSQYFLVAVSQSMAAGAWSVSFSFPIGDVALQFAGAYLVSQIVIMLAKGVRIEVGFSDSIVVYLWFNFLLVIMLSVLMLAITVMGAFGLLLVIAAVVWIPYAMAIFWSALLQTKNLFLGFVVALVAILIASAISVVVADLIGLPVMEITPNV